jgi:type I restriction enzyme S subunit
MTTDPKPLHRPPNAHLYPSSWAWRRLDDVCEAIVDCPHSSPALTADGPVIVRSQDIRSGVLRSETAAHVSENTYSERTGRAEPTYGDLLYSREGTYFGVAAEVPKGVKVCLGQRMVLIRPRSAAVDFRFLKYWLNSPTVVGHIGGLRDGSVAERFNLPTIRALPVVVPPLMEQRRIAATLSGFDDKAELNRRLRRTLESSGRAIFKSWFVDFDPVYRKIEGCEVGLSPDLMDYFPKSLAASDLGLIPLGWPVVELADLLTSLDKGVSYKGAMLADEGRPMLNLGCFGGRGAFNIEKVKGYAGDFRRRHLVRPGDLVVANTDVTQKRLVLGSPALVPPIYGWSELLFSHHVYALRLHPDDAWLRLFVYFQLLTPSFRERAEGFATGTTVLALPRAALSGFRFVLPPAALLGAFLERVSPMMLLSQSLEREDSALATLRDCLLPPLMSGDVRIG